MGNGDHEVLLGSADLGVGGRDDRGDGDQLGVDRCQVRHETVQVRRVTDSADEPGEAGLGLVDGEVVQERTEQAAAEPAAEHDLVGVYVGHASTVTRARVKGLHLIDDSPG